MTEQSRVHDPWRSASRLFWAVVFLAAFVSPARAQFDGARVYWPLPKNTNIVAVTSLFGNANASLSNWEFAQVDANISTTFHVLTYTRIQPVFNRTTVWTVMIPAGHVSFNSTAMVAGPVGGSVVPVAGPSEFIHGLADPSISVTFNILGAPGLKAKEYARYDLETNVALQVITSFPVGQYDAGEPASMGGNRYKFRIALPVTHAFGDWVPGRRLALDVMPAVSLFTKNDDYLGQEVDQDPTYAVEAHLSRDITKRAFLSLDYSFIQGGASAFVDPGTGATLRETDAKETHLAGVTAGFQINDNLQFFLTHMQTISDEEDPVVLDGSVFKLTLSWAWHAVLQRARDFHD